MEPEEEAGVLAEEGGGALGRTPAGRLGECKKKCKNSVKECKQASCESHLPGGEELDEPVDGVVEGIPPLEVGGV